MTAQTQAKTWSIDGAHSTAEFTVRHMMISTVRGSFSTFTGEIHLDPDHPEEGYVEAKIDVTSITTGEEQRDNHLRSADFFEVEKFPHITFKSTSVKAKSENKFIVTGDLTIRDVTKPVDLEVEYLGRMPKDLFGKDRVAFVATTKIDREEFGLTWNQALETGGVLVSKDINIELNIAAVAD